MNLILAIAALLLVAKAYVRLHYIITGKHLSETAAGFPVATTPEEVWNSKLTGLTYAMLITAVLLVPTVPLVGVLVAHTALDLVATAKMGYESGDFA